MNTINGITVCATAAIAIKAAKSKTQWGSFAATRYCQKRQVPLRLYWLACRLEAARKAGC